MLIEQRTLSYPSPSPSLPSHAMSHPECGSVPGATRNCWKAGRDYPYLVRGTLCRSIRNVLEDLSAREVLAATISGSSEVCGSGKVDLRNAPVAHPWDFSSFLVCHNDATRTRSMSPFLSVLLSFRILRVETKFCTVKFCFFLYPFSGPTTDPTADPTESVHQAKNGSHTPKIARKEICRMAVSASPERALAH
jgi:hypothetical protein